MLGQDIRHAVRALRRRPGLSLVAVLLLALGTGVNATVFSVVRGVLLRPLPFAAPEALVAIWPDQFVSNDDVAFWRDRSTTIEAIATVSPGWLMALVSEGDLPLKVTGARVSDNLFTVLGVGAALGRTFEAGESLPDRGRVTIISDALWRQRFSGSPSVLGRSVLIDEVPHAIVGVARPAFEVFGHGTDLWVPAAFAPGTPQHTQTTGLALGRLRRGATDETATRELAALSTEMRRALGKSSDWGQTLLVRGLQGSTTGKVRPALVLLLGAVGFILLLGAVNLGTLALGGAITRARELAVRAAVGASRAALVRQLLVEQAVLSAAGALLGLAFAYAALPAVLTRVPPELPRRAEIALDLPVFLIVLGAAIALALIMAALPALVAIRPGLQPVLRQGAATESPARQRALGALVAAQVALAVVLGIGASLMLRSLWQLQHVHPGFEPAGALTFRLQTTSAHRTLGTGVGYLRRVSARFSALPGVVSLGATNHVPLSGYSWTTRVHRLDRPPAPGSEASVAAWRFTWGDYFRAMRIPLIAGRTFEDGDTGASRGVAIVNEALAREHFGSVAGALGQRLVQQGGGRPGPFEVEIIGIVGDVRHAGLDTEPGPEIYRPLQQTFMFPMQVVLRVDGDPAALAAAVRQAAFEVDPTVPIGDLQPLPALLAGSLARPRLLAFLLSVFAGLGLLLSVVGLYAVVAVRVGSRIREIGIRMALGASPRSVAGGVVRQGIVYAAAGLALGLPAAFGLARFMESLVFGVTPRDPVAFTTLPLALVLVTLVACYGPARRAARVDPVKVMRGVE